VFCWGFYAGVFPVFLTGNLLFALVINISSELAPMPYFLVRSLSVTLYPRIGAPGVVSLDADEFASFRASPARWLVLLLLFLGLLRVVGAMIASLM